jgi:hypothetical protein
MTDDLPFSEPAKVCNFRATPAARESIVARSVQAKADLAAMDPVALHRLIGDTRPLHKALFDGHAPAKWPDAPGTYRGTPGTSVEASARAVFLARKVPGLRIRDICLPAAEVPAAIVALSSDLHDLWSTRPGHTAPYRDAAYLALARVTAQFFSLHPYMDGNGHIWRLILPILANRLRLAPRPEWTVDRRPYGVEFSLALQWYGDHPTVLADQLRRWLAPSA